MYIYWKKRHHNIINLQDHHRGRDFYTIFRLTLDYDELTVLNITMLMKVMIYIR